MKTPDQIAADTWEHIGHQIDEYTTGLPEDIALGCYQRIKAAIKEATEQAQQQLDTCFKHELELERQLVESRAAHASEQDTKDLHIEAKLPESFEDWLASNNDSIDIGGNEIPDRVQANHDIYKNVIAGLKANPQTYKSRKSKHSS